MPLNMAGCAAAGVGTFPAPPLRFGAIFTRYGGHDAIVDPRPGEFNYKLHMDRIRE